MQTRVWPQETRSLNFMPSALTYGQFNPIASVLPSKSFSMPVLQFIMWVLIVHLPTIHHVSTSSNHDNVHYWIVLFFMSYYSLIIQPSGSQQMTHWTWLLNGMEWNTCLHSWDNSVQSPRINHTFSIKPLEHLWYSTIRDLNLQFEWVFCHISRHTKMTCCACMKIII